MLQTVQIDRLTDQSPHIHTTVLLSYLLLSKYTMTPAFSLHPQAAPLLVSLLEEHMALVVREAVAVNRHCKRARLHQDHAETATSAATSAANHRHTIRRRLHAADVNMALQLLKTEQLYATPVVPPNPEDATAPVNLLEFLQRQSTERLVMPPSEVGIRKHWLAVDGKQPQIPQNPSLLTETIQGHADGEDLTESITLAEGPAVGPVQVQRLQSSLLSEELLLYYVRLTTSMERGGATPHTRQEQDAVLASVAQDAGLQELVPFMVRYTQQELYKHAPTNIDHCRTLIRLAQALLTNVHLHLELYLHELLPALMTCVVSKRDMAAAATTTATAHANHWALRREAAAVLVQACQVFGQEYVTLKARVLKALVEAATPTNDSLASRYGGMIGIMFFGTKAVDAFLLPTLLPSWRAWQAALDKHLDVAYEHKFAIQMCQRAALDALGIFLRSLVDQEEVNADEENDDEDEEQRLNWDELQDTSGDQTVVLHGYSTEYTSCFV